MVDEHRRRRIFSTVELKTRRASTDTMTARDGKVGGRDRIELAIGHGACKRQRSGRAWIDVFPCNRDMHVDTGQRGKDGITPIPWSPLDA